MAAEAWGILHLSDLHFGPYLQQTESHGEWANIPGAFPHHYRLVQGMEFHAALLLKEYKGRILAAITGDMTTAGEPSAYEIINNYIRGRTYVRGLAKAGLGLSDEKVPFFHVPGNHDYWHSAGWPVSKWNYKSRFEIYRKYFPEPLPEVYPVVLNGTSVTIYTLDSNVIGRHRLPFQLDNMLGNGEVGDAQLADMQTRHQALVQASEAGTGVPAGYSHAGSLKVLLLHHHLALPSEVDEKKIAQRLLVLKDAAKVKAMISDYGIHMVLCGHQHFPHMLYDLEVGDNRHKVFYACAGSATQVKCDQNSFFFYEFAPRGTDQLVLTPTRYVRNITSNSYAFKAEVCDPIVIRLR